MAITEAQRRATDKWQKENYEFVKLRLNKGEKDVIKAKADEQNKSINQFIKERVLGGYEMLDALKKIYNELGIDDPDIFRDYRNDVLTENECRNGRKVLWYMCEGLDIAVYVDTTEVLTEEEKEKELM